MGNQVCQCANEYLMKAANADVNRAVNKILSKHLKEEDEKIRVSTLERIRSYGIDHWFD